MASRRVERPMRKVAQSSLSEGSLSPGRQRPSEICRASCWATCSPKVTRETGFRFGIDISLWSHYTQSANQVIWLSDVSVTATVSLEEEIENETLCCVKDRHHRHSSCRRYTPDAELIGSNSGRAHRRHNHGSQ